jgi:hypothetical protein
MDVEARVKRLADMHEIGQLRASHHSPGRRRAAVGPGRLDYAPACSVSTCWAMRKAVFASGTPQ